MPYRPLQSQATSFESESIPVEPYESPTLAAEFISPPKVYTFSFIVGSIIPKKCKVYPLSY